MKILMFAGCAAILAGGIYFQGGPAEANVYGLPLKDTYAKLRAHEVEKSGKLHGSPFGNLDTVTSGDPGKSITWSVAGSNGGIYCKAHLIPTDAANTRIIPECHGGGEGAAAGMMLNMRVKEFIEMVDSTMTDRPYDAGRAEGSTAARWPKQEISNADIFSAQAEAMKMHAEMEGMKDSAN
jgi:hypothetical protein